MSLKQKVRDVLAGGLASVMRRFALDPRYFELWQRHGYHITQSSFYSPVPDTNHLTDECWTRSSELRGVNLNETAQLQLLERFQKLFRAEYSVFPRSKPDGAPRFYFGNVSLEAVDAEVLYCMVRDLAPKRIVEIGSGFSTLIALEALARNQSEGKEGSVTAIEPHPRSFLSARLPALLDLVVAKVQDISLHQFTSLCSGDILFIDSSHVCKIGSDVQYEFLEILPRLTAGVVIHIHDVFLPVEYPKTWVKDWHRFWNEQYLLQAFLCGNRDFEVLWAGSWLHMKHADKLAAAFPSYDPQRNWPASFWFRRIAC